MNKCIYTGDDDLTATFSSAEHIFPKCIGGTKCLPKGWVSDKVNNDFSVLELSFARNNPLVALRRMFGSDVGRKGHKNRYKIGVFIGKINPSEPFLGYIKNGKPFPLNQFIFSKLTEAIENQANIKGVIAPSERLTHEELISNFFDAAIQYNGCPSVIKDDRIPLRSYILGIQDNRWYLGISNNENPEEIKPLLSRVMQSLSTSSPSEIIKSNSGITVSSEQVTVNYSICFNFMDCYRVYAKIVLNTLAYLYGKEYILSPSFNAIKEAVLKGNNIQKYVYMVEGENPIKPTISKFPESFQFGDQFHSVVFVKRDGRVYGFISLYGADNPVIVELGTIDLPFNIDAYICDWENQKDYKLIDCVLKICGYDDDSFSMNEGYL